MSTKRIKIFNYLIPGIIFSLGIFFIISSLFFAGNNLAEDFPQGYHIITPEVPDYLVFAGERIPTENYEVKERIEREFIVNTYWHSATLLAIKRTSRWFPLIEPILKAYNIPDDFKYLCVAESYLRNVISPAGATGFWQFMKETGQKYGLEIRSQVDERYNLEKSTVAACNYLKDAYEMFGTWTMAAASYNMGTNGAENQMQRQKTNNYYNLVLNEETSRYIARIVALKYIMQNPTKHGFDLKPGELYHPLKYYEVKLDSSVTDLADFAALYDINYKILKMYNPWLRENYLNNDEGKNYKIKLPEKGSIEIIN
ncbi:MAG: lytic transglycosylase domain-containing protein [Ignavibacteriaceae bacterium]